MVPKCLWGFWYDDTLKKIDLDGKFLINKWMNDDGDDDDDDDDDDRC